MADDIILMSKVRNKTGDIKVYIGSSYYQEKEEHYVGNYIDGERVSVETITPKEFKNYERVYDTIPEPIVTQKRKVVIDHFIKFGDVSFDLHDLYETLMEVDDGGVMVTYGEEQRNFLLMSGVLNSAGSANAGYCATKGKNFDTFMDIIRQQLTLIEE